MASYYDEHNCKPLVDGERPDHLLHLARYAAITYTIKCRTYSLNELLIADRS